MIGSRKILFILFSDFYAIIAYKPLDKINGCMYIKVKNFNGIKFYGIMFTDAGNHTHSMLYNFFMGLIFMDNNIIPMKATKIRPPKNSPVYGHTCMINSTILSFLVLTRLSHTTLLSESVIKIICYGRLYLSELINLSTLLNDMNQG